MNKSLSENSFIWRLATGCGMTRLSVDKRSKLTRLTKKFTRLWCRHVFFALYKIRTRPRERFRLQTQLTFKKVNMSLKLIADNIAFLKPQHDDDIFDRMHYYWTTAILVVCPLWSAWDRIGNVCMKSEDAEAAKKAQNVRKRVEVTFKMSQAGINSWLLHTFMRKIVLILPSQHFTLSVAAALLFYKMLVGSPIDCWAPAHFPSDWEAYTGARRGWISGL